MAELRGKITAVLVPLSAVLLFFLLSASLADGNCGGEGENASMSLTPASLTFTVGSTQTVTIDNTGAVYISIEHETLPGAGGATFEFTGSTCLGLLKPGGSCSRTIRCVRKGEDTYTAEADAGLSASLKMKCD